MTEQEGFNKALKEFDITKNCESLYFWDKALEWARNQQEPYLWVNSTKEFASIGDLACTKEKPSGKDIFSAPLFVHPAPQLKVGKLISALKAIEGLALCNDARDLPNILFKAQYALAKWEGKQ